MNRFFIFLIRCYQCIPFSSHYACRCTPTCSEYTIEAIEYYGWKKGIIYGLKRIFKCRPGGIYGYQPLVKEVDCEKNS